jgi:RNA polymerase sigma-70 factor (ECF subfamily)
VTPFPDRLLGGGDPEASYLSAESVRLAFIVALQRLSAQARAVFLLRDVMDWRAREVADALGLSVPAVNSALHRARGAMADERPVSGNPPRLLSATDRALLERYVRAWVAGDARAVAQLVTENVTFSMPPNPAYLRGKNQVVRYLERVVLVPSRVSRRLVWTRANGRPGFGVYARPAGAEGPFRAHTLQVVTVSRGRVAEIVSFHDARAFPWFDLPAVIPSNEAHTGD